MNFSCAECLGCEGSTYPSFVNRMSFSYDFDQASVAGDSAVSGDISARRAPSEISVPSDLRAVARKASQASEYDMGEEGEEEDSSDVAPSISIEDVEYEEEKPVEEKPKKMKKRRRLKKPTEHFRCCCATLQDGYMDEKEVMKRTWWCLYCCCMGSGCGLRDPMRCKYRCVLCDGNCQSADCVEVADGICNCVSDCCGCYFLSQFPFRGGTPRCALCNVYLCGWHARAAEEGDRSDVYDHMIHTAFNPVYFLCCGFAVTPPGLDIDMSCKCCCCRSVFRKAIPADGDVIGCLCSCWTWYNQCRCPPKGDSNPICATCGKKLRKKTRKNKMKKQKEEGEEKPKAPKQEKMYHYDDYASNEITLAEIPEFE